jgi:hypothetical protein
VGAVIASQFGAALDAHLDDRNLSPAGREAVAAAKERMFGTIEAPSAPPGERALLARAGREASTEAFHTAMGIAAALVAAGGLLGLAGIQDPRRVPCRDVRARECPGGQIAGHPRDAARERRRPPAELPREVPARA